MSTHRILVTLDKNNNVVAHFPGPMQLHDRVHCHTNTVGGVVDIYFDVNGSPFKNPDGSPRIEIDSNDPPLETEVLGTFHGRCTLKIGNVVISTPSTPAARWRCDR